MTSGSDAADLGIDDDMIQAAVRRGRGSARDALSALDQMVALGGAYEGRPTVAGVTGLLADEDASSLLVAVRQGCARLDGALSSWRGSWLTGSSRPSC